MLEAAVRRSWARVGRGRWFSRGRQVLGSPPYPCAWGTFTGVIEAVPADVIAAAG